MPRVLLMNPNGNAATTAAMVGIARDVIPEVVGWTAPDGPPIIADPEALARAARGIAEAEIEGGIDGVIVSAFGDPGRAALGARLGIPVVGIAEAARLAARDLGGAFAVATHTPLLAGAIDERMREGGDGRFLGTFLTRDGHGRLGGNDVALDAQLLEAVVAAYRAGARSVIIGGGPLAQAAVRLARRAPCPLIEPIPEAARRMRRLLVGRS